MGRGSSKAGGAGGGATTPSGTTLDELKNLSEQEMYDKIDDILNDSNIKVPDYLDGSDTTKIMYALGINNKPAVVDEATLDAMQGRELYRTVYETGSMPPPSTDMVLDQIRNGDYTQMSGKGGSAHGRAIYFATDYTDSTIYGSGERNPMVMRAKLNPNANIRSEGSLARQMYNDTTFDNSRLNRRLGGHDAIAVYALTHGVDGWYSGTYTMMVNRGALTASSQNKKINGHTWHTSTNA
jgi:hypothetical protein